MDSSGFHTLVQNFTHLSEEESAQIAELSRQYPYSQVLHLVRSRAAQDLQHLNQSEILHQSAVYSTDRTVLKWVMTTPRKERIVTPMMAAQTDAPKEERAPSIEQLKTPLIVHDVLLSGDALRDDLYRELEKLQRLKHDFEEKMAEFQKSNHGNDIVTEPLMTEIKSTRKKVKVDSQKQKEQNEIIDQFIKTKPVIPKAKASEPVNDLAEDSDVFSDNIVSETLVEVLLKQGKKEKAIEVLKKLIWKFPQKKTYFAAQIEGLKN